MGGSIRGCSSSYWLRNSCCLGILVAHSYHKRKVTGSIPSVTPRFAMLSMLLFLYKNIPPENAIGLILEKKLRTQSFVLTLDEK